MQVDDVVIHDTDRYAAQGYPWAEWDLLREEAPVYWYVRDNIVPFWAITRHEDVKWVSGQNKTFINGGGRLRLADADRDLRFWSKYRRRAIELGWEPDEPPDFIFKDRPDHWDMRRLVVPEFTPKAMRSRSESLQHHAQRFAEEFVNRIATEGSADIVEDLAVKLPLAAICEMVGVSADDWSQVHAWTSVLFDDPDLDRYCLPGEAHVDMRARMIREFDDWISELIDKRRRDGATGRDLVSILLRSETASGPLTPQQLVGYLRLMIAAGNETTRNAASGGTIALLEHRDELDVLNERISADDVDALETAVEEILRWTSPVIQFARTCSKDTELRGQTIKAGEHVGVWYPSANRDERRFPEPYRFDVRRTPNDHLAFGHGAHFCLGVHLARWELRAFFKVVAPMLDGLRLDGAQSRIGHLHVGPIKHQMAVAR
ncbi:cytochrome P450 [Candidatus Poriferisodalis sp.]|uniref:cytochrome P450 n=1 Tax=Candidatus Poriferisodalis sp. TaxID=3101277 RepID=UPI003D0B8F1F